MEHLASIIYNMKFTPKAVQYTIKTLTKGYISYYADHIVMAFKMNDGSLTKNNNDITNVLSKHFFNVYNRNMEVNQDFINGIKALPIMNKFNKK